MDAELQATTPSLQVPDGLDIQAKLEALRAFLRQLGSALVCYSGGIDSALVLAIAHEQLGERAIGLTAVSPSLAPRERDEAARFARELGAHHRFVESHEIERPGYVANGPDPAFTARASSMIWRSPNARRSGSSTSSTAPITTIWVTIVRGSKQLAAPAFAALSRSSASARPRYEQSPRHSIFGSGTNPQPLASPAASLTALQ